MPVDLIGEFNRYAPFSIIAKRVEAMKAILVIFAVIFVACAAGQTMNQKANQNTGVEQELMARSAHAA